MNMRYESIQLFLKRVVVRSVNPSKAIRNIYHLMVHKPMFKMLEIDVKKNIKIIEQFWKSVFVHTTEVACR